MTNESLTYVPSTGKRLAARWLDQIFISAILVPVLMMFPESEDGWIQLSVSWAMFILLFPLAYEAIGTYLFSATPGKWIFNLKIVPTTELSKKHWFVHSLIRALISYVGLFLWALFATGLFRYDRRHLGDWLAETRVVGFTQTKLHRVRPLVGALVVVLGLIQGGVALMDQIQSIDFEDGYFYVPDPTVVDFGNDEGE